MCKVLLMQLLYGASQIFGTAGVVDNIVSVLQTLGRRQLGFQNGLGLCGIHGGTLQ